MKKSDTETNQKNDNFNNWIKMSRHSATVDNFPFIKVFTDDQRAMNTGADLRELFTIINITKSSEQNLAFPFFFLEEIFHDFLFNKFYSWYLDYRFKRADNSLVMHFCKAIVARLHKYYTNIYNTYSFFKLDIETESGKKNGETKDFNYFLMPKKIYSKRYSTDCFSDFFDTKALSSLKGLSGLKTYAIEKATLEELQEQNSYFINSLIVDFDTIANTPVNAVYTVKKTIASKTNDKATKCLGRHADTNGCADNATSFYSQNKCCDCPNFGCKNSDCSQCSILDCIYYKE